MARASRFESEVSTMMEEEVRMLEVRYEDEPDTVVVEAAPFVPGA